MQLRSAVETTNFDELLSVKSAMEALVKDFPHLNTWNLESIKLVDEERIVADHILLKFPPNFYILQLTGIADKAILLSIDPSNITITTCEDMCAINTKSVRLLEEMYGIKSPVSKCASHLACGTTDLIQ